MNIAPLNFYSIEDRRKIRANPRVVFDYVHDYETDDIQVKLVENTATTMYMACQKLDPSLLSKQDLGRIAGGVAGEVGSASTAGTAASASTAGSVCSCLSSATSLSTAGSISTVQTD